MRIKYDDLKHEIERYNKKRDCTLVMTEYHESNIYSLMIDGYALKIGTLSEIFAAVKFLNVYIDFASDSRPIAS